MSENPLNVLKRKLEDEATPLTKRLRLAKNVVHSRYFSAAPKERIVADWLHSVTEEQKLRPEEFKNVLYWPNALDDLTSELKSKLIKITSQYLTNHAIVDDFIPNLISFIENDKLTKEFSSLIDDYCFITKTLLKHMKNDMNEANIESSNRVLNHLVKYNKETNKKLEYLVKILEGDTLETIFEYLDFTGTQSAVQNLCQTLLFPINKKTFFASFLRTLLQKENIEELLQERGENIQSILKVMSAFFTFPSNRISKDAIFLQKFIRMFVQSFKLDHQLVFAFYIMVATSLNLEQSYISPTMKLPAIVLEGNTEKAKRNIFLDMLQVLFENEVDINVKLTDTLATNLHVKKTFLSFLQSVLLGQLKLEGKLDKTSLKIIKTALKLDPALVEQKLDIIVPSLMVTKKNNENVQESYTEMINCLLEILFKLNKGMVFVNQLLPHLKIVLEACNTEQFELKQSLNSDADDLDKIKSKIIIGDDVLPPVCVKMYGKLTSELMFRQNSELLTSLQKDFELHCLMMLEEGFVSPSIITLTEVMSAILSTFFDHNKMADHTVPQAIADEFWNTFITFEVECLKRFGDCLVKLNYNPNLTRSFLRLCQSYSQLKLLNIKYSNVKIDDMSSGMSSDALDASFLFPKLSGQVWMQLIGRIPEEDAETKLSLNNMLLVKTIACELLSVLNSDDNKRESAYETKTHLIKELSSNIAVFHNDGTFSNVLTQNLDPHQLKLLSKHLVKYFVDNSNLDLLASNALQNNAQFLKALTMEVLRNVAKILERSGSGSPSLGKAMNKTTFELTEFLSEIKNVPKYFEALSLKSENIDEKVPIYMDILKELQICYADENCQLTAIFVLFAAKSSFESKKAIKAIDNILQPLFELSPKSINLYKLFPIEYIFDFEKRFILDLMTLKIKTSNPKLLTKCVLENAVKKVKTNSEIIKILVKLLLQQQKSQNQEVFQTMCMLLPLLAKQRKIITASAIRTILAEQQEKLYKSLLKSFKNINFNNEKVEYLEKSGNPKEEATTDENYMATLNAMEAYSLTLTKYCESTDKEEIKNLDYLWVGLGYFLDTAIRSIKAPDSKRHQIESSIQLLNVVLRNVKKLESHDSFASKDKLYKEIWLAVKERLFLIYKKKNGCKSVSQDGCLENLAVTLKFVSELASVDCFASCFIGDLFSMMILKKLPATSTKPNNEEVTSLLTSHQVGKFFWISSLKGNLIEQKCVAMSKSFYRTCRNFNLWIRQHYDGVSTENVGENGLVVHNVDAMVCDVLKIDLDVLAEIVMAAKKIPLNPKFLDSVFEAHHMVSFILGRQTLKVKCQVEEGSYLDLYSGLLAVLNSLLMSREELLEDRWPCYMQCYRALVASLCERANSTSEVGRGSEEKLATLGHKVEKLTQSIAKRKLHVSRLAAYSVADLCSRLRAPPLAVRQPLERSGAILMQAADSTHAMAFLRRALAGSPGHMTLTNMYTMYKRYHKYVGNA